MSEPMQIKVSLFDDADAEEPPASRIRVEVPDMGLGGHDEAVASVGVEEPATVDETVTIGAFPMWIVAAVWVVAVSLNSQAVKIPLKAVGLKERMGELRWKRWMFCVPILVGALQGYLLGPRVAAAFRFEFDAMTAVFLMGVPSGAAAPWVYMGFRHVVMPMLPAAAIGIIERITGISLPDEVKAKVNDSGIFDSPSEVINLRERDP